MRLFARNEVHVKSRFWYFLKKFSKLEEEDPTKVKNFGVWLRYDSRSGTHNMYKEYRDVTRVGCVEQCYNEMGSRHRVLFRSVQIIKVASLKEEEVKRTYIRQLLDPELKFPLPHRVIKPLEKRNRAVFTTRRATTFS